MWNSAVITNAGKELLANWLEGATLNFDSAATGEGMVADAYLMAQTGLVAQKQTLSIVKMDRVANGVRLQLQCTSAGVTAGYIINQIGVWASLNGSESALIALYQDGVGVSVPTHEDMPDYVFTFYATLQMSNTGVLTATIDHEAMVTRADFDAGMNTKFDTAGAGLKKDGTTIKHTNSVTAGGSKGSNGEKAFGDKIIIPYAKHDTEGHITESGTTEITLPSNTATANADGLMSKEDKAKLDAVGIISITGATVTLGGSLTYNGSTKTKTVSSVVVNGKTLTAGTDYVVSGNTATNAGTYTLVITGIGQYVGAIGRAWEIAKANGSASTSVTSLNMVGAIGMTRTFTVLRSGDGAITVSSSDVSVAQATVSGTTVTVKAVKSGSATITVNVDAETNYKATSKTVAITATVASATLNDNSWATIKAISDAGAGASVWSVGATKEIEVKGTVGTLNIDQSLWVYVIGFNHNATYEGSNRIHFQGFKTAQSGGKDVGLVDSKYNSNYNDGTKYFNINHWGYYNYGGWSASDLRYDVLGSTNVAPSNYGEVKASGATGSNATNTCATNPMAGTLMAALPSDLRAVLKPITKYTDNVGGGSGSVQSNVTATTDYLPLLSMKEVFGSTQGIANSYEGNCQAQYTYYANGNSKVKYKHSDVNTAAWWWLRSPYYYSSNSFCAVWSSGSYGSGIASYSAALAPAFAV